MKNKKSSVKIVPNPFNEVEVNALKMIASKVTNGASKESNKSVLKGQVDYLWTYVYLDEENIVKFGNTRFLTSEDAYGYYQKNKDGVQLSGTSFLGYKLDNERILVG